MDNITVRAPATVSNVVCGFDCLGFALDAPFDEVSIRLSDSEGIRINHLDNFNLPTDPQKNVAGVALRAMLDAVGRGIGVDVEITKHIKPGSGIGSSSASSCGAVVALNRLLDDKFSALELVRFAMEGEMLASGARHADNVAPSIFGGFSLVRSTDPLDIVRLDSPSLFIAIIHPQIEIKTADARAMLPANVTLKDAVRNWSNLASFIAALGKGDLQLMARSMIDVIVEPVRKNLIPMFDQVRMASLNAGAIGGGISGSGPSIFMLAETIQTADEIAQAMAGVYDTTNIDFNTYVSAINPDGVRTV